MNTSTLLRGAVQRGFTIIELLVTVAILAILTTLVVPSMSQFVAEWRVNAAVNTFSQHLRLARTEAVKRSRAVTLCPANAGGSACATASEFAVNGWIVFVDSNGDGVINANDDEILAAQVKGGASRALPGVGSFKTTSNSKFTYKNNGLLSGVANKTFTVTSQLESDGQPRFSCKVTIASTGRLSKTECKKS